MPALPRRFPARSVARRLLVPAVVIAAVVSATPAGASTRAAAPAPSTLAPLGDDFLWGVSTSGFQSEGHAQDSNWTRYEAEGSTTDAYANSADFYDRYESDIALAKGLGVKVYRLSIEWSRVQPTPGVTDPAGLAFYDRVLAAIHAAGMRPMITLDHWVYPGWEADRGGWKNPAMITDWLANATTVVDRYAGYDPLWVTFNEASFYVAMELKHGGIGIADAGPMFDRLAQAHNAIYDHIHAVQPGAMVTSNVGYAPLFEPLLDGLFLDHVSTKLDYVGIDSYYGLSPANLNLAALGPEPWLAPQEPESIYYALRHYAQKFPGRPLYIVENGMPTDNGTRPDGYDRATQLQDSIYWVQRAKADGINVIGYNYWSLTDNYEWGTYAPRFGLYTVDVKNDPTLTRRPTDAVAAYQDITARGGDAPDYLPSRAPVFCSFVDAPTSCTDPVRLPG